MICQISPKSQRSINGFDTFYTHFIFIASEDEGFFHHKPWGIEQWVCNGGISMDL